MPTNPLLDQLDRCPSCAAPIFRLVYGDLGVERDLSDAQAWLTADLGPVIEPIAGGIHPSTVCTSCGRIDDLQTDRAIIWNVRANGSAVPKLVPPLEQPWSAVYETADWDAPGACDLFHLACLRGRWSDDVELEAVATGRLLDAERRLYEWTYSEELRGRAETLLADARLSWASRIELHSELGRDARDWDPDLAFEHLCTALTLGQDDEQADSYRAAHPEESLAVPDLPWLAIDTAEAAHASGRDDEALQLLRWAVPSCTESDIQARGASLGASLAHGAGDGDFELDCELIRLHDECPWMEPDAVVDRARDDIVPLLEDDPSGQRRQRTRATVERWSYFPEVQREILALLDR